MQLRATWKPSLADSTKIPSNSTSQSTREPSLQLNRRKQSLCCNALRQRSPPSRSPKASNYQKENNNGLHEYPNGLAIDFRP